ncbi:MAG TPA: DJ-1/PfpI family protein [Solirubrobacterales bacterium]|jgi:transcriptional regulator GlxA family with amidase domain|nr:DJ-1/PfpI family protein [Solirubrobacterales bacterium]
MAAAPRQVVLVGFEGMQLLDLSGPGAVFDAATRVLEAGGGGPGYALITATPGGEDVRASCGMRIGANADLGEVDPDGVDTLLIAGGRGRVVADGDPRLVGVLPRIAAGARRVCSVCGGAFLLAAAGLLHGRRVTTHWAGCEELARRYPELTVEPDRIYLRDGDVFTSAGVTAGIDLALALVEEDHAPEVARTVARWLVVFLQRPGGQSQFSERLELPVPPDSPLRSLVDRIVAEPASDHRVAVLAEQAGLSERQLSRVFSRQARTTPARFVERVRVEAARDLLEAGALSVEAVAGRCGFGSAETMRRSFHRVLGVGPAEYRARFASSGASSSIAAVA